VIGQRLDQDVTDYPKLGKRLSRNIGEWTLVEHAAITKIKRKKQNQARKAEKRTT